MRIASGCLLLFLSAISIAPARAQQDPAALAEHLEPWVEVVAGRQTHFTVSGNVRASIDGKPQTISMRLVRDGDQAFDLELHHEQYAACVYRRPSTTVLLLPKHNVAFVGSGPAPPQAHLAPGGILKRLVSPDSAVAPHVALSGGNAKVVTLTLAALPGFAWDSAARRWSVGNVSFSFNDGLQLNADDTEVNLRLSRDTAVLKDPVLPEGVRIEQIDRTELERQLCRGVFRATEILAPGKSLIQPKQVARRVPNGELIWQDGQRLVRLWGSPEEIGTAHGQILKAESQRCIDSVLNTFGTVQTIATGRWFRRELAAAYQRLKPHIPERHQRETRALAAALEMDAELLEELNVFPELFHCSGFAVFNSATTDGKLYHGRVLDYMTTIGLQDAATTFVVQPTGRHAFANIGYASFIGSVSGMNDQAISLGEMGGRGEGQWDGVPMATLMRRALEECSTLDEVMTLWRTSPRTCEYYYVFADGKTNTAVGVAAVPEKIEFVQPGQGHELLGDGISDAVVLSAGDRLRTLRSRVQERHGKIDTETAIWLMSRPVAMQSNLHNVLFVPADGVFYVANASHNQPAAERNYVKYELSRLLSGRQRATASASVSGAQDD